MGLGNPILSDDAAGLSVARRVYELLGDPEADLVEAAVAGLKTVQLLTHYDRGVIIDSMCDGSAVGQVRQMREEELGGGCPWLSHGVNLHLALELARRLSLPLPQELLIYVVAVKDPHTFGEQFTPEVERALPAAAGRIADDLAGHQPYPWREAPGRAQRAASCRTKVARSAKVNKEPTERNKNRWP